MQPEVQEGALRPSRCPCLLGPRGLWLDLEQHQPLGAEDQGSGCVPWRLGLQGLPGFLATGQRGLPLCPAHWRASGGQIEPPVDLGRAAPAALQRVGEVEIGVLQEGGASGAPARRGPRCGPRPHPAPQVLMPEWQWECVERDLVGPAEQPGPGGPQEDQRTGGAQSPAGLRGLRSEGRWICCGDLVASCTEVATQLPDPLLLFQGQLIGFAPRQGPDRGEFAGRPAQQ